MMYVFGASTSPKSATSADSWPSPDVLARRARRAAILSPRVDPRAEANRETSPPVACVDAIAANAPHASVATVTTAARAPKDRRGASTSERSHASSSPSSVARSWVLASVPSSAARSLAPIVRPFEADMTSETRSRSFTLAVDGARVAN